MLHFVRKWMKEGQGLLPQLLVAVQFGGTVVSTSRQLGSGLIARSPNWKQEENRVFHGWKGLFHKVTLDRRVGADVRHYEALLARNEVYIELFIRAELYIVVKGTQREATIHERSFRSVPYGFPIAGYYQPMHGSMVAQGCAEA